MSFMTFMEHMGTSNISLVAAFFIGLMTAVSPCPLTTNITAVVYVSGKIRSSKQTMIVGFIYTLGRVFTYAGIASLIVYAGLNTQRVALFLQAYEEKLVGPLLIVFGLVMVEAFRFNFVKGGIKMEHHLRKLADKGYIGGFLLGMIFALAFCPFSAVLYFGMLILLAFKMNDGLIIPSVFAIATGLPVIIASILLVKGVSTLGNALNKVQVLEKSMRKFAGIVFIITGMYTSAGGFG